MNNNEAPKPKRGTWLHWMWNGFGAIGCAVVMLVLLSLACCGFFIIVFSLSDGSTDGSFSLTNFQNVSEDVLSKGSAKDKIAVVQLVGEIASPDSSAATEQFVTALQYAREQEDIKKVIVLIDSPGGEVVTSDLLYRQLKSLNETKQSVVYIRSLGASGGYYTALGGDRIFIHPEGITGSIGVITQVLSLDGLYEKLGIESRTFKTGRFKDSSELFDNNPNGEAESIYKSIINESYDHFVDIVAERREISREQVVKLADGRIYTANQAKANNLVDELGTLEDVIAHLRDKNSVNYTVVQVKVTPDFFNSLNFFAKAMSGMLNGQQTHKTRILYLYQ